MEEQRQRGRAHVEQEFGAQVRAGYQGFVGKTEFVGYEATTAPGVVVGILRGGEAVESLKSGEEGEVFLDRTPFYGEAGGQVGDRGTFVGRARLSMPGGGELAADVLDTYYPVEGAHAHRVRVQQGEVRVGREVEAVVDRPRRQAIARAHTATHLLHFALRQVLGPHALQSGSLVEADRLRFDFAHFAALTPEEKQRIEDEVNRLVLEDDVLGVRQTSIEEGVLKARWRSLARSTARWCAWFRSATTARSYAGVRTLPEPRPSACSPSLVRAASGPGCAGSRP